MTSRSVLGLFPHPKQHRRRSRNAQKGVSVSSAPFLAVAALGTGTGQLITAARPTHPIPALPRTPFNRPRTHLTDARFTASAAVLLALEPPDLVRGPGPVRALLPPCSPARLASGGALCTVLPARPAAVRELMCGARVAACGGQRRGGAKRFSGER